MTGGSVRARAVRSLACLTLAAASVACIDITVDTSEVGAVEVLNVGDSAVVTGDTLRNAAGTVTPVVVNVYDAGGKLMSGRSIRFVTADTFLKIDSAGRVIGGSIVDSIGQFYVVVDGKLQSVVQRFTVVSRPDTLELSGRAADSILYRSLIADPYDSTTALGVRVRSSGTKYVNKWQVTFALRRARDQAPITDTTRYAIVRDPRRVSNVATTDAAGTATRRVRILAPLGTVVQDTLELVVRARYRGADIKGSPKIIPIIVKPAPIGS